MKEEYWRMHYGLNMDFFMIGGSHSFNYQGTGRYIQILVLDHSMSMNDNDLCVSRKRIVKMPNHRQLHDRQHYLYLFLANNWCYSNYVLKF